MQTSTLGWAALLLAGFVGSASAQEPAITLGRLTVSVGMTQDEVIRRAEAAYQRLSSVLQIARTAVVWEKNTDDDSNRVLGSIGFENGRVNVVFKNRVPTLDFDTSIETARRYTRAKVIDMIFFVEGGE